MITQKSIWRDNKPGCWVGNVMVRVVEDKPLVDLPESLQQVNGRAAQLIIDGLGGGTYDIWFISGVLRPKPDDVPLRNTIWLLEDTFFFLVIGKIELGATRARNQILISGETSLYDSIEFQNFWDQIVNKLRPVVLRVRSE